MEAARQQSKNATVFSRHSRFGGTFTIKSQVWLFLFSFFILKKVNVLLNNKIHKKISEEINVHKDIALLRQDFSLGTGKKPKARTFRKNDKMDVMFFSSNEKTN